MINLSRFAAWLFPASQPSWEQKRESIADDKYDVEIIDVKHFNTKVGATFNR